MRWVNKDDSALQRGFTVLKYCLLTFNKWNTRCLGRLLHQDESVFTSLFAGLASETSMPVAILAFSQPVCHATAVSTTHVTLAIELTTKAQAYLKAFSAVYTIFSI